MRLNSLWPMRLREMEKIAIKNFPWKKVGKHWTISTKTHWQGMKLNHSLLTTIKFISFFARMPPTFSKFQAMNTTWCPLSFHIASRPSTWNIISSTFSTKFFRCTQNSLISPPKIFVVCCLFFSLLLNLYVSQLLHNYFKSLETEFEFYLTWKSNLNFFLLLNRSIFFNKNLHCTQSIGPVVDFLALTKW